MNWRERIDQNPKVMFGKPVIKGTRLTVEFLLQRLGQGAPVEDLLDSYPGLTEDDLKAACLYAAHSLGEWESTWIEREAG